MSVCVTGPEPNPGSENPSKKVSARPVVKSRKSSIRTSVPGVSSGAIPPLTAVAITAVTPTWRNAHRLAR